MSEREDEEQLLREVTLQSATSIFLARRRAEEALVRTQEALERKTRELAQSLARMRATLESTTDGILVTDGDGRVTDFNRNYVEMWRVPAEVVDAREHRQLLEICGRQFHAPRPFLARIEEIYASSPPESYDLLELADGRMFERFSKIQYVEGLNVGRVWSFRDVTERRHSEEALREQVRLSTLRAEIAGVLAESGDLPSILQRCAELLVQHLQVAFARIWTLNDAEEMLELQASAGVYTHRDGPHGRVKVGQLKIGRIAQDRRPHLTNNVLTDVCMSDPEWARREGMVAFAGYPLLVESRCVGVLAMFARLPISEVVLTDLAPLADGIAQCVERKRAEEALREQSEWLQVTLSSIGDAVITTDIEGRITSLNPVAEALTGWAARDAAGLPLELVFRIFNEQSRLPVDNPATRSLREGKIVGLANHTVLVARGGIEHAIDDSAAPIRDDQGTVIGVVLIFRDVSERRRDEERLRQSEARFRQLADSMPQIVWTARPDGFIDYYNERWYEYSGFTREEYGDASWQPILHPDDLQRCVDTYYGCIRAGDTYQIEHRFKDRSTGGYRWFLGRAYPVRDAQGQIVRWFGTYTDIDDTKRGEETTRFLAGASAALTELTDYASTLQKVASLAVPAFADWCAVDMCNADGSLSRLAVTHSEHEKTQLAHDLFRRYPPQPADPHGLRKVLSSGDPEWVAVIPDALLAELAQDEEHLRILRQLGLKSYVCVPLKSRTGVSGVITFVTAESGRVYDADDLRAAEDLAHRAVIAIENANLLEALKESDRRKDEFLAILAHELRNPLAPIRNALQILHVQGQLLPELQWARALIDRQLEQMTRLVDDLLDVSRITRGKMELRKERIELGEVVNDAVEASRSLVEGSGHTLTVQIPSEPIFLDADPTRLAQVLLNLLNNAAKYTEPGGRIRLTAEREEGQVVVRVKDTGVGIPADMLPHIFGMFTQVDRSLERSQGGLGIGLTLVQRLVAMHGGTVEAHSPGPGRGSEFVVRLPTAAEAGGDGGQRADSDERSAPSATYRILVVDDNRDSADSLAMLLGMLGHEVRAAHDGLEALEMATVFQPRVVLLDIGLPKLSGYDVARRLREQFGGDVVLIALTGWGQEEDRRRSQEAGFDHHLTKPAELDVLSKLLADATPHDP